MLLLSHLRNQGDLHVPRWCDHALVVCRITMKLGSTVAGGSVIISAELKKFPIKLHMLQTRRSFFTFIWF